MISQNLTIEPQPGPQTKALACPADILIYGGAAGGGKSWSLLVDPLRNLYDRFDAVIFRRTTTQVRNPGGLWDEAKKTYMPIGAHPQGSSLSLTFPQGLKVKFAHLEHEDTVYDWQGAAVPFIGYDELTHFSRNQFFYMLTRNRSLTGIRGRIRATTNPDPDSWVAEFISWWIHPETGFPIPERDGVLRYFIRRGDDLHWENSAEEIYEKFGRGPEIQPKSVTFIAAKVEDNKILLEKDPSYLANLEAQNLVDRMRLRHGNWKFRASAGTLFRKDWFPIVDAIPSGWVSVCRFWDRAATRPSEENKDPDWTRGLKVYKYPDGRFLVADLRSTRDTPAQVENLIKNTASHDGHTVSIRCQRDPGSAGVSEAEHFVRMLQGYDVSTAAFSKDKVTRAKPASAQAEVGNIWVLRSPWNNDFFAELENFGEDSGGHDDIVDTLSGAFNELSDFGLSLADVLYRGA
jgi:predicted phage terminase large subunit-like protein